MITSKDIMPVIQALETINVRGADNIGTMNNIFKYLNTLCTRADEEPKQEESEPDEIAE